MMARRDRVVGNVDRLVVGRGDHRREELDVAHGSRLSLRRDVVADAVGFHQQDHHPAGKVLGRAAQSHTDGQRGGRRDGDERCHVDAQRRHDDQDEQQREERADGITRERTQRNVDIAVLHGHVDQPQEAAHEPASDEIDGQRNENLDKNPERFTNQRAEQSAEIHVHDLIDRFGQIRFLHTVRHDQRGRFFGR